MLACTLKKSLQVKSELSQAKFTLLQFWFLNKKNSRVSNCQNFDIHNIRFLQKICRVAATFIEQFPFHAAYTPQNAAKIPSAVGIYFIIQICWVFRYLFLLLLLYKLF